MAIKKKKIKQNKNQKLIYSVINKFLFDLQINQKTK